MRQARCRIHELDLGDTSICTTEGGHFRAWDAGHSIRYIIRSCRKLRPLGKRGQLTLLRLYFPKCPAGAFLINVSDGNIPAPGSVKMRQRSAKPAAGTGYCNTVFPFGLSHQ